MNAWRRAYPLETGRAGVYNGGMKCIILRAGEREIAVETERKRVRNLNLRVRADGSVHVSAPMRVSEKEVRDFVLSKAEWIGARVAEAEKRASVSFAEGGALPYLGGSLPVVVKEGARTRVTEAADGTVTVAAPSRDAADRALSRLLITKAKKVLPAMFAEAQAETGGMFGAPVIPTVRVMRSRWGSCDRTKRAIKLNALLVTAPPECVRYVCLHELAHLKVHGHGADFHALLERLCPGHRALKRRLDALALRRLP